MTSSLSSRHLKWLWKNSFFRKPTFNSLYDPFGSPCRGQKPSLPLRKAPPFSPSLSSIVFTPPSVPPVLGDRNPQGREDVTALRCSEPLRYKVGGPKRSSPCYARWTLAPSIHLFGSAVNPSKKNFVYTAHDRNIRVYIIMGYIVFLTHY